LTNSPYEATIGALEEFDAVYKVFLKEKKSDKDKTEISKDELGLITDYYDNARQGVNKGTNRKNRADVITKFIKIRNDHS
jgi:hypothetical protein